jgi:hypothetical protein
MLNSSKVGVTLRFEEIARIIDVIQKNIRAAIRHLLVRGLAEDAAGCVAWLEFIR